MLVKHSERSLKRKCNGAPLWWAHDTDVRGHFTCTRSQCQSNEGHGSNGRLVYMHRDGSRHTAACRGTSVATPDAGIPPSASAAPAPAAYATAPAAPVPTDDAAALTELLGRLTRSRVDRAEVEGWAREAIRATEGELREAITKATAAIHVPTVVHVRTNDGPTVPLPGTHHRLLPKVIAALARRRHVMLVGPAGSGKSHLAHQAAEALGLGFGKIGFTPDTSTSALLGYQDANGHYHPTQYRHMYEGGGVFCCDEIDNGHPSILTAMNDGLSNGSMAFDDAMVDRHDDFRCVATANTYGRSNDRKYVGRMPIDAATRNRFVVVDMGYDLALEDAMAAATGYDRWQHVTYVVRELRERIDDHVINHVVGPRQVVDMCELLQTDEWCWDDCVDACLRSGLTDADWAKVSNGVNLGGPR